MPYIPQSNRAEIDPWIDNASKYINSHGKLNYAICRLIQNAVGEQYKYEELNGAIGALEAAKLEIYRRMAAPYEDGKVKEHGDVF